MRLTITVAVDSDVSDLFPFVYLFRPDNAPDLLSPVSESLRTDFEGEDSLPDFLSSEMVSIWTKFDDGLTEIDYYLPFDPEGSPRRPPTYGPLLDSDEGIPAKLINDVLTADPAYRLLVTGYYYETTDGNYWSFPIGRELDSYSVNFSGTANASTALQVFSLHYVPEPASWMLLALGLLALMAVRRPRAALSPALVPASL